MAVLYITEFSQPTGGFGGPQAASEPPVAEQTLSFSGTAAASSALNAATSLIRITSDTACSVCVGTNPTAQAVSTTQTGAGALGTQRLAAGVIEYKNVKPGQGLKVSAITTT